MLNWRYSAYFFHCLMYTITHSENMYAVFAYQKNISCSNMYNHMVLVGRVDSISLIFHTPWCNVTFSYLQSVCYTGQPWSLVVPCGQPTVTRTGFPILISLRGMARKNSRTVRNYAELHGVMRTCAKLSGNLQSSQLRASKLPLRWKP